ncbi:hypothetical protein PQX77_009738 [Marasmius sp. AFHP31]|nr:hypothetical protein PQX77_009738 [Marasmius sp. AFHP31]
MIPFIFGSSSDKSNLSTGDRPSSPMDDDSRASSPPESDTDPGRSVQSASSEPPRDTARGRLGKRQAETEGQEDGMEGDGQEDGPTQLIPQYGDRHKLRIVERDTNQELEEALESARAAQVSLEGFKNIIEGYATKVNPNTPTDQAKAILRNQFETLQKHYERELLDRMTVHNKALEEFKATITIANEDHNKILKDLETACKHSNEAFEKRIKDNQKALKMIAKELETAKKEITHLSTSLGDLNVGCMGYDRGSSNTEGKKTQEKNKIHELRMEKDAQRQTIEELLETKNKSETTIQRLTDLNTKTQTLNKQKGEQHTKLLQELATAKQDLSLLKSQYNILLESWTSWEKKAQDLTEALGQRDADIDRISKLVAQPQAFDVQGLEKANEEKQTEINRLTMELSATSQHVEALKKEKSEQAQIIQNLTREDEVQQNKIRGLSNRAVPSEGALEVQQLEEVNKQQQTRIDDLQKELSTLETEKTNKETSVQQLESALSDSTRQCQTLGQEKDALNSRIRDLTETNKIQETDIQRLSGQTVQSVELLEARATINKLSNDLAAAIASKKQGQQRFEMAKNTNNEDVDTLERSKEILQNNYNAAVEHQAKLQAELQEFEAEKEKWQQELEQLQAEIADLKELAEVERSTVKRGVNDLQQTQERLKRIEHEKKSLSSELRAKTRELGEKQCSLKEGETSATRLGKHNTELSQQIVVLASQVEALTGKVSDKDDEIATLKDDLLDHANKLKEWEGQWSAILVGSCPCFTRAALRMVQMARDKLQEEVETATSNLTTSQAQYKASNETITALRADLRTTKTSLRDKQRELGVAKRDLDAAEIRVNEKERTIKTLNENNVTSATNNEEEKRVFTEKIDELEDQLQVSGTEKEALSSRIQTLNARIDELNLKLAKSEEDMTVFEQNEAEIKQLKHDMAQKTQELEEFTQKSNELEASLKRKEDEISDLNSKLAQRTGDATVLEQNEAEIKQLKHDVAQRTKELEEFTQKSNELEASLKRKEDEISDLNSKLAQRTGDATVLGQKDAVIQKLNEDVSQRNSEISRLSDRLKEAEDTINKLKDSTGQAGQGQSPPPPTGESVVGQLIEKLWELKKPVTSVNVEAERRRAEQNRPKVSFGGNIPREQRPTDAQANPWAEPPVDDNVLGDDDVPHDKSFSGTPDKTDAESDFTLRLFDYYTHKENNPKEAKRTDKEQKNNLNLMLRRIVLEALPIKNDQLDSIWAREGVSAERLGQSAKEAAKYGPKIHNTHLDKRGQTTDDLRKSNWNETLRHRLETLAHDIVARCPDAGYFPQQTDELFKVIFQKRFKNILKKRFEDIYRDIHASRPQTPEEATSPVMIAARLYIAKVARNERNAGVSLIRHKFYVRINLIHAMITRCKNDEMLTRLWKYALRLTENLGANGMSNEEKVTEEITTASGVKDKRIVMWVLKLSWRHPYFREFYRAIDAAPHSENLFGEDNRNQYPRVLSDKVSTREPPKGLFASVFDDKYWAGLLEFERSNLRLDEEDVVLEGFNLNGYQWPPAESRV